MFLFSRSLVISLLYIQIFVVILEENLLVIIKSTIQMISITALWHLTQLNETTVNLVFLLLVFRFGGRFCNSGNWLKRRLRNLFIVLSITVDRGSSSRGAPLVISFNVLLEDVLFIACLCRCLCSMWRIWWCIIFIC